MDVSSAKSLDFLDQNIRNADWELFRKPWLWSVYDKLKTTSKDKSVL